MGALLASSEPFRISPDPFVALMVGGFVVGVVGYLYGSRTVVALGVAMVFLATFLIPLALNVYR